MKKLTLDPDAIRVTSFAADAWREGRGTVRGNAGTLGCTTRCGTAAVAETCYAGCTAEACEPTFAC